MKKKDMWKKLSKYRLKDVKIDFEFHLHEPDVVDAERVDEEVRIIQIPNTNVEFGVENDLESKDKVNIVFGFGSVALNTEDFIRAVEDWKTRNELKKLLGKR